MCRTVVCSFRACFAHPYVPYWKRKQATSSSSMGTPTWQPFPQRTHIAFETQAQGPVGKPYVAPSTQGAESRRASASRSLAHILQEIVVPGAQAMPVHCCKCPLYWERKWPHRSARVDSDKNLNSNDICTVKFASPHRLRKAGRWWEHKWIIYHPLDPGLSLQSRHWPPLPTEYVPVKRVHREFQ